jgi:hypothetical protein
MLHTSFFVSITVKKKNEEEKHGYNLVQESKPLYLALLTILTVIHFKIYSTTQFHANSIYPCTAYL